MTHEESNIQIACVTWFRLAHRHLSDLLFSVPNGAYFGRDLKAKMRGLQFVREGMLAGVADLLLLVPSDPYHGLCIEMKTKNGRQSPSQKAFQQAVEKQRYKYIICHSFDEFEKEITAYLNQ